MIIKYFILDYLKRIRKKAKKPHLYNRLLPEVHFYDQNSNLIKYRIEFNFYFSSCCLFLLETYK